MGNQLVECQECHNLYHQDCHKPQVTDKEVNDPRLVWYCARCTRQMKRMVRKINYITTFITDYVINPFIVILCDELLFCHCFCEKQTLFVCPLGPETPTETIPCICIISTCCERHVGEKDGA